MTPLRFLLIEDNHYDAELIMAILAQAGYTPVWDRAETRHDLLNCLARHSYDLVLSDYRLPQFDGLAALNLLREHQPNVPFILVSGTLGEETAIESLKAGATDYVLKDRLARLVPVVERALRERDELRQHAAAEGALRDAEARYRELVENSTDMIYTHDLVGNFSSINQTAERLTGYAQTEAQTMQVKQVVPPEYQRLVDDYLAQVIGQHDGRAFIELEIICKDGKRMPVEVIARAIWQGGTVVGVQGTARDISERKRGEQQRQALEAQLMQAQKMETIGTLAGGIAHDFNNLLTAILGNVQLALEALPPDHAERTSLLEIEQAAGRAAALTRQLLTFSRREPTNRRVLDLNHTVDGVLQLLRRLIADHVEISAVLVPDLWPVLGDRGQIEQVLMNLAINARDALPNGGKVEITTHNRRLVVPSPRFPALPPGAYVEIAVCDNGVGMDLATQARIFEPFFTTKPLGRGTGLGLAVVYGIVKQHDGLITVGSTLGHGTTFRIVLPAAVIINDAQFAAAGI